MENSPGEWSPRGAGLYPAYGNENQSLGWALRSVMVGLPPLPLTVEPPTAAEPLADEPSDTDSRRFILTQVTL
ncbi:hypothetical protein TWF696_008009 [Orbilia brochopaga]|uniref:Uncharacterized protein n=1 Tax=Orbilia brochopaga TaxID=3140254 RepID=A0AAV9UP89_9PEZI